MGRCADRVLESVEVQGKAPLASGGDSELDCALCLCKHFGF